MDTLLVVFPVAEAGGAENLLVDVLTGLQETGMKVAASILGEGPLRELCSARGIPASVGPALSFRRPGSVVKSARAVRRAVKAHKPDIVLASHPKGQVISRLACVGHRSIAHVTQLYDPPSRTSVSTQVAARLPGLRLAITEETAAAYRALNQKLNPIVILAGTDCGRLRSDAARGDGDRVWAEAGVGGDGPRLVMVGRLQRFKGPFDFLDVATEVSRARSDARFLIIGPDSPIEPGLRRELEAAIEARGLRSTVSLAGRLSGVDLAATVRGATLVIHPAHREPFGLAVVEALALGTPVVAYETAGPSAILAGGGGAVVPVGDAASLGKVVLAALDDADQMEAWIGEAPGTAARFDVSANVQRYRQVLLQAASPAPEEAESPITTVVVAPHGPSGVRDYGRILNQELRRRGLTIDEHWLENTGDVASDALRVSAQLLWLGVSLPSGRPVVWHYSPVAYGFRGLPAVGVLMASILRMRGCPVVTVLHELAYTYRPGSDGPRGRFMALVQGVALRVVLAGSQNVIVSTEQRRAAVEHRRGGRSRGVHVIPVFPTIPCHGRIVKPRHEGPLILGVPAYAGDGVRPDLLIAALPLLGGPADARVVLLGAPGCESPDGRRWARLASEQGMLERLEFTGVVEPDELSRRFSACDVIVLMNEEGPSSRKTSLAGSLALGMPVVSLDGFNRWDAPVEAGAVLLVRNDPVSLAAALVELRDSPAQRADLSARAIAFATRHMSVAAAAESLVALLTSDTGSCRGDQRRFVAETSEGSESEGSESEWSSQPSRSHGSGATA